MDYYRSLDDVYKLGREHLYYDCKGNPGKKEYIDDIFEELLKHSNLLDEEFSKKFQQRYGVDSMYINNTMLPVVSGLINKAYSGVYNPDSESIPLEILAQMYLKINIENFVIYFKETMYEHYDCLSHYKHIDGHSEMTCKTIENFYYGIVDECRMSRKLVERRIKLDGLML